MMKHCCSWKPSHFPSQMLWPWGTSNTTLTAQHIHWLSADVVIGLGAAAGRLCSATASVKKCSVIDCRLISCLHRCRRGRGQTLLSDSEWEADTADGECDDDDAWGGADSCGSAVLLTGPVGSGKTAAAYAVATVRPRESCSKS